jgi:hypothetical protein
MVSYRREEASPTHGNKARGSYYRSANEGNVSDTPRLECADRVLSELNECAARAWPKIRTNVVARIFFL